jgi:hypothetical protein
MPRTHTVTRRDAERLNQQVDIFGRADTMRSLGLSPNNKKDNATFDHWLHGRGRMSVGQYHSSLATSRGIRLLETQSQQFTSRQRAIMYSGSARDLQIAIRRYERKAKTQRIPPLQLWVEYVREISPKGGRRAA